MAGRRVTQQVPGSQGQPCAVAKLPDLLSAGTLDCEAGRRCGIEPSRGLKGRVRPCSVRVWLSLVLARGLRAAVSDGGASPVWPCRARHQGHARVSAGSQAEPGLEKVPGSLPHSP